MQGQSDIEKIKEKLLQVRSLKSAIIHVLSLSVGVFLDQSPNVPKKKERFHNFVKNTYRVQDEKVTLPPLHKILQLMSSAVVVEPE